MSTGTDTFGDIAELATALGVLGSDGSISTDFFVDPATTMGGTLRDGARREALLKFLDDVLGDSAPQVEESAATWTPIFKLSADVHLYLVTAQLAAGISLGIGVRGATSGTSHAEGRLSLPLVLIPPSGPAVFLPGSNSADAVAELAAEVDVGSPNLQSVGLTAAIPVGAGASGDLTVTVTGLRVPGSDTPLNLSLDSFTAIGPQLLHVVSTLVETELRAAAADIGPEASTLLGLLGLAPDSVVPLPLADLAVRGLAALRDWLGQLANSDAALQSWFAHLTTLVGATASGPFAADVNLAAGVDLRLGLVVDTDDTGGRRFAPTFGLTATVAADTAIELEATLFRASIGAHPSVTALPKLECHARYGAATGLSNILDVNQAGTVVKVGALRAGVGLDETRRPVFVLAADRVQLGPVASPTTHAVLDLTSPDALAEAGGQALSAVLGNLIAGLGSAGASVSELLGLSVPAAFGGVNWPTIDAAALIADPVNAWLGFQRSVLALGTQAFADLLSSAATLLGKPAVANAAGTDADPWVVASTGELSLVAWTTSAGGTTVVHFGVRWLPTASQIGGVNGPTPALRLIADALALTVPTLAGPIDLHVLPSVTLAAGLTTPVGHPVQVSLGPVTIDVPAAEVVLSWTTAAGAHASFDLPGATITVDAATTPIALPTIDGGGQLVLPAGLTDHVLEALLGGLLHEANAPWLPPLVQALGLGDPAAAGAAFSQLLTDPRGWVVARLRSLLTTADPAALDTNLGHLADVLAALVGTPSASPQAMTAAAVTSPATVSGAGRPDDPLVIPIQAGPASLELALWLDPAGPPIPAAVLTSLLEPTSLTNWLDSAGAALTSSDLARLLNVAGKSIPGLADLVAGRGTLGAGWDALVTRCAGGDGLLPGGAPDIAGATASTLAGIAHHELPAHLDLTTLAGLPAGARVVYVTGPYVPPWFDTTIPTLDLTTPTLPDTAFDTSAISAAVGPWHVRLPFRDDCPGADATARAQACVARLNRAVAAAASGGKSVVLVAHGPAAAGIARLAATGAPVVGVVLLGASATGVPLDVLDQPPMADALALARRLLPTDATLDGADLALGRSVIGLLGDLLDATHDPAVDLTPPAGLAAPAVPTWSVRGSVDSTVLTRALGALVRAGLAAFQPGTGLPENPGAPAPAAPTAVRASLRAHLPLPSSVTTNDPAGVSLDVIARLDLGGFALAENAAPPPPALQLDVEIYRANGWLAGGPQGSAPSPGVLRTPSLRRAKVSVAADLTSGVRGARATVTLLEGSALGVSRDAWVLGFGGEQIGAETRVLVGRLAAALGPVPTTGPVAALVDLLTALRLADPTTTRPAFGLSVDAIQQLLVDPANALNGAFTAPAARLAAADALRRLLGATGTAGVVQFPLGAVDIGLDLTATPPALAVSTTGIALGGGPTLTGSAHVDASGAWSGNISLAAQGVAAFGSPGIELALGPSPSVALTFGAPPSGVPNRITLFPPPSVGQIEGVASAVLSVAGASALRALIGALRTDVLSAPQRARFDPVLTSLGLLTSVSGPVVPVVPFGLFSDPIGYLARAIGWSAGSGPSADRVATLVDGLRDLLGLGNAAHGVLPISTSVTLNAGAASTGGLRLAFGYTGAEGDLTTTLDAGITVKAGAAPAPHLDLSLGLTGHTAQIALALDGPALAVTLHTAGGDIALLPAGPGLGSLATTAVQQALPYVLDALHDHAPNPVPTVLAAVRDVLGLGATSFDAAQLQSLAANPGAELLSRLVAHGSAAFASLQAVLPAGLPAPWSVTADTSHLRVAFGAQWVELRLVGGPPVLTVEASVTSDLPGITGANVTLDATLDTTGFRGLTASAQVAPANALTIGPLSFAPIVEVAVGPAAGPARIEAGLVVVDGAHTRAALLSIDLNPVAVALRTRTDSVDDPNADPAVVVTHVLVPLVADAALQETHVHDLLATHVGAGTLASLLGGVLLTNADAFDTGILALDPADLMTRLVKLIANIAGAAPLLELPDNLLLSFSDLATRRGIVITVKAGQRADLIPGGDIGLAFEVDNSWVDPVLNPPGLSVMIVETAGQPRFIPPLITVDGVGLRLYRRSGALLDTAISIGSIGLFGLLRIDAAGPGVTDGGLALQLADVAIAPAAAAGGSNGVAQGILGNTAQSGGGGDSTPLKPKFSPELALQKRQGAADFAWSLTAGPGNGPWLLHIGRSFGPLRIDDVGFGDEVVNHKVTSIRIFISGGLSLAGLNIDVQELSIGAPWPDGNSGHALTDPTAWSLDLAGLAVSYSGGGVQLAGGLRRRDNPSLPGNPPDYVGVLLAKVGPYGLTAFGGYGQFPSPEGKFTALFIFAAINAPIGGPPAFFVTGLGGGAGINRALILPTELNDFASFPMIAALDPHSTLADNPEHAMDLLSSSFPPQHGTFWFAAGVSFTSFALVDVVAVVAIEVGNGFAITLLGLARAALPTTYLPLVQLELALMAHFSTSEGILEVRAQLTDNSYLLTRDCRLTGGFAYVSWFSPNPNAGQFVLTIGGYHPSFHRDGYPDVPRVGFRWDVFGCLTIIGESYFALTSEAIMVGTRFTASLCLGPLWASLTLGVDAIVFFDPFHFLATGYASIAAGITIDIDLFFGHITVTLSFHLGAQVTVEGPDFHGSATIDLDVTSATIAFGGSTNTGTHAMGWDAFAQKYLTGDGGKPVLSAAVRGGAITPGGGTPTPDGSDANPWLLVPEFSFSVASTAAANAAAATVGVSDPVPIDGAGWATGAFTVDGTLAIAPMQVGAIQSRLGVSIVSPDGALMPAPVFADTPAAGISVAMVGAPMPKGVWAAQLPSGAIPSGDTITAGTGLTLTITAFIAAGSPPINYAQVQPGERQPLPFGIEATVRPGLDPDAANAASFAAAAGTDATTLLDTARSYLDSGRLERPMTAFADATFRRDRVAPPRLALLTEGIAPANVAPPALTAIVPIVIPPIDMTIMPPVVTSFLAGGTIAQQRAVGRTTAVAVAVGAAGAAAVGAARDAAGPLRVPAPTLAAVTAGLDPAFGARLRRTPPLPQVVVRLTGAGPGPGPAGGGGLAATDGGPITRRAAAPGEAHALPGLDAAAAALLRAHEAAFAGGSGPGATLRPGDVLVTTLPNHERDLDPAVQRPVVSVAGDAAVRVVALSAMGEVLADETTNQADVEVPAHTARLVAWCVGGNVDPVNPAGAFVPRTPAAGFAGWSATDLLPHVGAGVTLARDCVITGLLAPRRGHRSAQAGHLLVAGPAAAAQVIRTALPAGTSVVVVSLDAAEAADLSGLTIGIDGASRMTGPDGTPVPPVVVSARGRTHLVYDLVSNAVTNRSPGPVGVTIGTDPQWRVVGVMGGVGTAASTASLLAASGAAHLLAPLLRAPTGSAQLRWSGPPGPTPIPPGLVSLSEQTAVREEVR
jgi:hypothetical protein